MIEIRIHGRGGQGNVVAAYFLAMAAIEKGRYGQAFPAFGAERRGAPVVAFVRIDDQPIRRRCQVGQPGYLIVQDEALLYVPGVLDGLGSDSRILVNSTRSDADLESEFRRPMTPLAATAMAKEILGRPVPNTALLSGFFTLTGMLPREALVAVLSNRFKGKVLEKNVALVEAAAERVEAGSWGAAA